MQIARKNRIFIYFPNLPLGIEKKLGLFRQFADTNSMIREAARRAPKEAKAYIYPHGGVTYPK
jgi:hypothetical protein